MAEIIEEAMHNNIYTQYVEDNQPIEPSNLWAVEAKIGPLTEVLLNPRDLRDVYVWDIDVTGVLLHERRSPPYSMFLGDIEFKRDINMTEGLIICKSKDDMAYIVKGSYEWLTT